MSVLDGPIRQVAETLIPQFGVSTTITTKAGGTYDPDASEVTGENTTTGTASAIIEDYEASEIGENVQKQDKKIVYAASDVEGKGITPTEDSVITVGSRTMQVITIQEIWSGEEVALYVVQARR